MFYTLLSFSIGLYLLPYVSTFANYTPLKNRSSYVHITAKSLFKFFISPILVLFLLNYTWVSPVIGAWFGHITFSSLQHTTTLLILFTFFVIWHTYLTSFVFNSKEIYDYTIVVYNFVLWTIFLFYANNIFTVIFIIETLSVLTTLTVVTAPFSSSYFYSVNLNNNTLYFSPSLPTTLLNTLTFLFWISLVSSLILFVFLIFFYVQIVTFNFLAVEAIFNHLLVVSTYKQILSALVTTFLFILVMFFKCGVVPLYVWKPVFFKGMPLHVIYLYTCFFYYFLLLFFTYFLIVYLDDLTYYNSLLLVMLLLIGVLSLFVILLESFYIKAFLAMSSVLNTLVVFLAVTGVSTYTIFVNL
jgi:hypothetical protein